MGSVFVVGRVLLVWGLGRGERRDREKAGRRHFVRSILDGEWAVSRVTCWSYDMRIGGIGGSWCNLPGYGS